MAEHPPRTTRPGTFSTIRRVNCNGCRLVCTTKRVQEEQHIIMLRGEME